jgi:hypothetical protein
VTKNCVASLCLAAVVVIGGLGYLREPPWLAGMDSGFRRWETAADGTRYRWIAGHASFFVPATVKAIVIPPVLVSVAIDDRPADEIILRDDRWMVREVRLPPPGRRGFRRIDIRVDRLRPGMYGAQVGEVGVR